MFSLHLTHASDKSPHETGREFNLTRNKTKELIVSTLKVVDQKRVCWKSEAAQITVWFRVQQKREHPETMKTM